MINRGSSNFFGSRRPSISHWLSLRHIFAVRKEHLLSVGLMLAGGQVIPVHPVSQKLILCIDDNPAVLSYEKALLERSGYSVVTAASAQQGLRLVTTCKFDAVVLDYEMPDMNGCDVAFEIKRVRPELVVILLSGSDVPIYSSALVDAFILKLDASRQLLPTIAALWSGIRYPKQKQEGFQP